MSNAIKIHNLTFRYRREIDPVISDLNCEIPCGQIVAITGKSGIGKSTLLRLMAGVYRKSDTWSGQYYTGEISILGREPQQIRGPEQVSLMTQGTFLMNHLTVKENILLPCSLISEPTIN